MSIELLERIEEETEISSGDDEGLDHIICHCNLDKGWCGAEVEVIMGGAELNGEDCPECEALGLKYVTECPYGCSCTEDMRLMNCSAIEDDDD
jgi:hypothetical protein